MKVVELRIELAAALEKNKKLQQTLRFTQLNEVEVLSVLWLLMLWEGERLLSAGVRETVKSTLGQTSGVSANPRTFSDKIRARGEAYFGLIALRRPSEREWVTEEPAVAPTQRARDKRQGEGEK